MEIFAALDKASSLFASIIPDRAAEAATEIFALRFRGRNTIKEGADILSEHPIAAYSQIAAGI